MEKKKKCNKYISLAISILFFVICGCIMGVTICADSKGYMEMISAREPVYPLLLAFMRKLFGVKTYLFPVIILQNLLMGFAVWYNAQIISEKFELRIWQQYVIILLNIAVSLMCVLGAKRASMYSNSILTEGIAIPLYIIFFTLVIRAVTEDKLGSVLEAAGLITVMYDTRKQMAVGYIILCGAMFLAYIGKKHFFKKVGFTLLCSVLSLLLAMGITGIYNYALRGEFAKNTRDMNLVLTTSLYVADREDAELIEDEYVRELFVTTYDKLDDMKCNYKYADKGWRNLESHYTDAFDKITVETTGPLFVEYAVRHGFKEGMEAEMEADRISKVIVNSLLKDNMTSYLKIYLASLGNGFINTVAKRSNLLDYCALVMYLLYTALTLICLTNGKTHKEGVLGLIVLMAIVVNVGVTAALIFCQTRYMIYNMALFYSAGFIMLSAVLTRILRQNGSIESKNAI